LTVLDFLNLTGWEERAVECLYGVHMSYDKSLKTNVKEFKILTTRNY